MSPVLHCKTNDSPQEEYKKITIRYLEKEEGMETFLDNLYIERGNPIEWRKKVLKLLLFLNLFIVIIIKLMQMELKSKISDMYKIACLGHNIQKGEWRKCYLSELLLIQKVNMILSNYY